MVKQINVLDIQSYIALWENILVKRVNELRLSMSVLNDKGK